MEEVLLEDEATGMMVSNMGRVFSKDGHEFSGRTRNDGYKRVSYKLKGGKEHQCYVHRLVARNFLPNPLNLPFINHIDENPSNNRVDNLEWCTAKHNSNHGTLIKRMRATQIRKGLTRRCRLEKDGKIFISDSLKGMTRITGLTLREVSFLVDGQHSMAKGFHLPGVVARKGGRKGNPLTLSNGKETVTFKSRTEAANYIGGDVANVSAVALGRVPRCRGWFLVSKGVL